VRGRRNQARVGMQPSKSHVQKKMHVTAAPHTTRVAESPSAAAAAHLSGYLLQHLGDKALVNGGEPPRQAAGLRQARDDNVDVAVPRGQPAHVAAKGLDVDPAALGALHRCQTLLGGGVDAALRGVWCAGLCVCGCVGMWVCGCVGVDRQLWTLLPISEHQP